MKTNWKSFLFLLGMLAAIVGGKYLSDVQGGFGAKECLRIVDQDGKPVQDAEIYGGFVTGHGLNDYTPVRGTTDAKGRFTAQGRTIDQLSIQVFKEGFYPTKAVFKYGDSGLDVTRRNSFEEGGKWQPYGQTHELVLKRIVDPVALCRPCVSVKIPVYDEWVGFDIEVGKWVPPYGDGRHSDVLLRFRQDVKQRWFDFTASMDVSFTNMPYAGFYRKLKDEHSEFVTVYHADSNEVYQTTQSFKQEVHNGAQMNTGLAASAYLVFRTRTKTDENGKLLSAHYGVIRGPWNFYGGMSAGFMFNPQPNDVNLEDKETARLARLHYKQYRENP